MKVMLVGFLLLVTSAAHAQSPCQSVGVNYQLTTNDYAALAKSYSNLNKTGVEAWVADPGQKAELKKLCMTRLFNSQVSRPRCTASHTTDYWSVYLTKDEVICVDEALKKWVNEQLEKLLRSR